MDCELLRATFATLEPRADELTQAFYDRLLGTFPQVRPLFAETDFDVQRKKLIQSIAAVVALADRPDELAPVLERLGESHRDYGVEPHMYRYVGFSLLVTLAEMSGDGWTADAARTWEAAIDLVSEKMIEAQAAAN